MTHRIILAPMEGLVDAPLRDILTRIGGIDRCVSEFIRVTEGSLNLGTIRRIVPESLTDWKTAAGVPVHPQLLGSSERWLAHNAALLAELGAPAVDLNFGCPAKTVNRHRGGAVLLKEPETLYQIVAAVRAALPANIPLTTKMRLGYDDTSQTIECAHALEQGGAAEIAVHARTKTDGYKPPADWDWLAKIRAVSSVPIIANGDVNNLADYQRIRDISGCAQVMIGRGLVARPDLGRLISCSTQELAVNAMNWGDLHPWLLDFYQQTRDRVEDRHAPGRLKQWLGFLARNYEEGRQLFSVIRRQTCAEEVKLLMAEGQAEAA